MHAYYFPTACHFTLKLELESFSGGTLWVRAVFFDRKRGSPGRLSTKTTQEIARMYSAASQEKMKRRQILLLCHSYNLFQTDTKAFNLLVFTKTSNAFPIFPSPPTVNDKFSITQLSVTSVMDCVH